MGELHKIGFDTYRKTESKVKVVIDDGKEVVSIVLFFSKHILKSDVWFSIVYRNIFYEKVVKSCVLWNSNQLQKFLLPG